MSVADTWRPKRPGPASDRDSVTRQTLRAGTRAPPAEKPYINVIGELGTWELSYSIPKNEQQKRSVRINQKHYSMQKMKKTLSNVGTIGKHRQESDETF